MACDDRNPATNCEHSEIERKMALFNSLKRRRPSMLTRLLGVLNPNQLRVRTSSTNTVPLMHGLDDQYAIDEDDSAETTAWQRSRAIMRGNSRIALNLRRVLLAIPLLVLIVWYAINTLASISSKLIYAVLGACNILPRPSFRDHLSSGLQIRAIMAPVLIGTSCFPPTPHETSNLCLVILTTIIGTGCPYTRRFITDAIALKQMSGLRNQTEHLNSTSATRRDLSAQSVHYAPYTSTLSFPSSTP